MVALCGHTCNIDQLYSQRFWATTVAYLHRELAENPELWLDQYHLPIEQICKRRRGKL